MTKLTKIELADAEAELMKKYKGIVRGSLTNCQTKGEYKNKRLIKVKCPKGHVTITTTQELFHCTCGTCGDTIQTAKSKSRR